MAATKTRLDKQGRTEEEILDHYKIERELASRLLNSSKAERKQLYTALYDELFQRVPHHPQLTRKVDAVSSAWVVNQRMQLLSAFLKSDSTYLEVGPGDCSLAITVAQQVKKVYAVDVSTGITSNLTVPNNFELVISDGCSIPVAEGRVNIAYSHQLMEHLHPDDAFEQLKNIYNALVPGGVYICITPNRLSGPHDVSRYFDEIATGFHLKEYTVTELYYLFRQVGFSKVTLYKSYRNLHIPIALSAISVPIFKLLETLLAGLPFSLRRRIANTPMLFRSMTIVGTK